MAIGAKQYEVILNGVPEIAVNMLNFKRHTIG